MARHGRRDGKRTTKKVMATIAVAGTTAAAISAGTFAAFTGSDSATSTVDTASMAVALDGPGQTALESDITNAVPGDQWQRAVQVDFTGDLAATDGALDFTADGTNAAMDAEMTVSVDQCALPWTAVGDGTFTCLTPTALVTDQALGTTEHDLGDFTGGLGGTTKYLRVTTKFNAGAGNALQGATNDVTYTFKIDQRTADTSL